MAAAIAELAASCTGALGLLAGGLAYASTSPGSQLFGHTLIAGADLNEVALTFDDGPNQAATPQLIEVLARHNVRATFFCIGNFVRKHPALVREIAVCGHLVGNHTMSHPWLSIESEARIRQELAACNAALEDVTGAPIQFFRPPFGARRPAVLRAARELGLTPVMWNVTSYDWERIGPYRILANLRSGIARNRKRRCGSNLLLHDGGHLTTGSPRMDTVIAVDQLLGQQRGTSHRFVTVDAWR